MTAIDVQVERDDVDRALEQFLAGVGLEHCCPVQHALQAHVDRPAVVFQASWHLGARDKVAATAGVALPDGAVAFIAKFDAWARTIRGRVLIGGEDFTAVKDAVAGRPGALQFSVAVPA